MMPELSPHAPDNPEFARVIELRQLRGLEGFDFDIAPEPREAEALARLLDARSVRKMRFRGRLEPLAGGGWQLAASLGATVVQSCVVTLDPVTTRIDQRVQRTFLPETAALGAEILVDPEEEDEIEPLTDRIDLGRVAVEALALALPAYPRKPGASLPDAGGASGTGGRTGGGEGPADEEDGRRPFAALAALRGKLDDES
ncbi:MAG TPA: DUF177 domain-containing protein [Amaricoccus sp.]|nr:DUF177 domain-containing protein [Amaricoccus sp.]